MSERLYFDDAYLRRFEATVTEIDEHTIFLDQTAFYPTGGGQPHDTGVFSYEGDTWQVTDVHGRQEIAHVLEGDALTFDVGDHVAGELAWDRRYALMRYHTAQHLLSAVLIDAFDAMTTGNQLYTTRARIDCAYPRFEADDMAQIEQGVNAYIEADHPVRTYVLDRPVVEERLDTTRTRIDLLPSSVTEVRIVEIGPEDDPIDRTACAGTHVNSTGEIPLIEVTGRETKGSEEERLAFRFREQY